MPRGIAVYRIAVDSVRKTGNGEQMLFSHEPTGREANLWVYEPQPAYRFNGPSLVPTIPSDRLLARPWEISLAAPGTGQSRRMCPPDALTSNMGRPFRPANRPTIATSAIGGFVPGIFGHRIISDTTVGANAQPSPG